MSLVIVTPETVAAAASDVARIGSSIGAANAAAAGSTTSVLAAGADEVSAAIATLFGSHAREYQAISTQVAAFHDRFAQTLSAAVGSYVSAEATNAAPLATLEHNVLNALNAPTQALLGRPLIGDGAAGAPGTGQAGGAGGILFGYTPLSLPTPCLLFISSFSFSFLTLPFSSFYISSFSFFFFL
ncbi:PE family protein, partial [Mycobacterium tuberculosis]|uniref:PE family protein n=1 Tax=Mycobacterium tuberculosis TaxID=1773 RepID=UPI00214D2F31